MEYLLILVGLGGTPFHDIIDWYVLSLFGTGMITFFITSVVFKPPRQALGMFLGLLSLIAIVAGGSYLFISTVPKYVECQPIQETISYTLPNGVSIHAEKTLSSCRSRLIGSDQWTDWQ